MPNARSEWTVLSMLKWATSYFDEKEVKSPRLSVEWLLAHVLQIKRLDLYLKYDRPLSAEELDELRPLVKRRANHEPLQYITGETEFYNSTLKVNPDVLIPRQETEQMVQLICDNHKTTDGLSVLDIGTGSGCISIALKKEFESWEVNGIDISDEALVLARENATLNNVEILFVKHDLFNSQPSAFSSAFDIIVSNPPYILAEEEPDLDKEVKDFEPHLALFCNNTREMFEAVELFCSKNLKKNGVVYLEFHENNSDEVAEVFSSRNWTVQIVKDFDEKDRFLVASKE
ncbi:MAG: protein-(glutamine-N5) methyltransferase, release factor-specific [Bacteroidetes bacterium]|nr:protein-(glutamine-N5) methyltransferase, release factor-specific [Bacteroidota bacterium]MAB66571.1 protein-(glutamine-N5) methyltransferase, release factor-specific [Bacteroidota bacterium]|tara:strand:+ start:21963 stop:22826 length:864 start_codon:yes stop_codon:yes gene_type:complete